MNGTVSGSSGVVDEPCSSPASLTQATRALRALSAGNRTLLRAISEPELLDNMCRAVVETGGYRRAGVVFAEPDARKTVRWMTLVGPVGGKAKCLGVSWLNDQGFTYADTALGQTAVAEAIRTGLPCVGRDLLNNPLYAQPQFSMLREQATREGYAAVTAFPLIHDERTFGALFMAASEPDAFDQDEVALLRDMADDLAFGIASLRLREQYRVSQEMVHRQAFFDARTGLPNRTRQLNLLAQHLAERGAASTPLALVHVNIGRYAEVGNVFGHEVADRLMDETVRRLQACLPNGAAPARVGDAIFSILLPEAGQDDAVEFAGTLVAALNSPIEVASVPIDASVHAGVVVEADGSDSAESLFRHANAALFHGPAAQDKVTLFAGSRNEEHASRLLLMGDLRHAVKRNELRLFCQPKVDLHTHRVVGAEVLVRWSHPTLGMISPARFIGIAEQSGLIVEVTKWLLDASFAWLHAARREGRMEKLAINLSAYDLLRPSLVADLTLLVDKWGVDARHVEFELTESALIEDPVAALEVLTQIKALGVQLLIDDFGTGYSSLSYLQRFPFDVIKIDQSFVMPMLDSADSAAIVHSTIELGHILGRQVIAEGVEDAEVWRRLREYGCDLAQGYLIARPIPIDEFHAWKSEWHARHAGLA